MGYITYRWRFRDKGYGLTVLARDEKTALEIVAIENTENDRCLKRRRFGYKRRCEVRIPPYELEQEQLKEALRCLELRRKRKAALEIEDEGKKQ